MLHTTAIRPTRSKLDTRNNQRRTRRRNRHHHFSRRHHKYHFSRRHSHSRKRRTSLHRPWAIRRRRLRPRNSSVGSRTRHKLLLMGETP